MLIDKIAWLEVRDKKLLSTRSKGRSKYYIPGGKREAGETDLETLYREINEELDILLVLDTAEFMGIFEDQADSHPEGIKVKMTCYKCHYQGQIKPSSEIEEVVWLTSQDIESVSPVDKLIMTWLRETDQII